MAHLKWYRIEDGVKHVYKRDHSEFKTTKVRGVLKQFFVHFYKELTGPNKGRVVAAKDTKNDFKLDL